jgi:hypothetical protein
VLWVLLDSIAASVCVGGPGGRGRAGVGVVPLLHTQSPSLPPWVVGPLVPEVVVVPDSLLTLVALVLCVVVVVVRGGCGGWESGGVVLMLHSHPLPLPSLVFVCVVCVVPEACVLSGIFVANVALL